LKAQIKPALSSFIGAVEIRASGGGMLGRIDPFSVDITGPSPITVDVPLRHHTLPGQHPPVGGIGIGLEDITPGYGNTELMEECGDIWQLAITAFIWYLNFHKSLGMFPLMDSLTTHGPTPSTLPAKRFHRRSMI
jgi:hypothetical protein